MPRSRQLITDFSSGEVSPRINTRADWEGYAKACKEVRNWIIAQQGGVMLRRGFEHVGPTMTDGGSGQNVLLIEWRGGATPNQKDILFELVGNRLRGWTVDGQIMDNGSPYEVEIPGLPFNLKPDSLQTAQRGELLVLANPTVPPILIWVRGEAEWVVETLPRDQYPFRRFLDVQSAPPPTDGAYFIEFSASFEEGDLYRMQIGIFPALVEGLPSFTGESSFIPTVTLSDVIAFGTVDENIRRIRRVLEGLQYQYPAEFLSVTHQGGNIYRISSAGGFGQQDPVFIPSITDGTRTIQVSRDGPEAVSGREPSWSFPTVVRYDPGAGEKFYRCIQPHISETGAGNTPDNRPDLWEEFDSEPEWEALQPSEEWSPASASYGLGDRGFPSAVVFHEQRLIFGGTKAAPATLWGSAIGNFKNFTGGVESDQAWSVDLDASDSPYIRWLASQNGLWCGTSAGLWLLTAQVTLSPTDIRALRYTSDRCERRPATVAGNEVMFIPSGRRQLRTIRFNQDYGPYETFELSMLAEHLGRCGVRRIVYCQQPQPMVYLLVDTPGRIVAISYNRQGELAAFSTIDIDGIIEDIGSTFEQRFDIGDEGNFDVLWAAIRRGDSVSMERIQYPVTINPCATLTPTTTKHLDGWVIRDASGGEVTGLKHLVGRDVTVVNPDGTIQKTATVQEAEAENWAPVAITNGDFSGGLTDWNPEGAVSISGTVALFQARNGVINAIQSEPVSITGGKRYRVRCFFSNTASGSPNFVEIALPIIVNFIGSGVPGPIWFQSSSRVNPALPEAAELVFVAPAGATAITVGSRAIDFRSAAIGGQPEMRIHGGFVLELDDTLQDGVIEAEGEGLIVGEPFHARLETFEPVGGNPTGPSMGNKKRWSELFVRVYESAMPLVNGQRPSDNDQADPRATPERLRSGSYKVTSLGHNDGSIVIEQDLPYQTQVIGVFGDMQTGNGG